VVADTALARSTAGVVLNPIAGENPDRSIVHLHREVNRQLALAVPELGVYTFVDIQPMADIINPVAYLFKVTGNLTDLVFSCLFVRHTLSPSII
jgi:hypothetical protein